LKWPGREFEVAGEVLKWPGRVFKKVAKWPGRFFEVATKWPAEPFDTHSLHKLPRDHCVATSKNLAGVFVATSKNLAGVFVATSKNLAGPSGRYVAGPEVARKWPGSGREVAGEVL
jgi:hypothetical protein